MQLQGRPPLRGNAGREPPRKTKRFFLRAQLERVTRTHAKTNLFAAAALAGVLAGEVPLVVGSAESSFLRLSVPSPPCPPSSCSSSLGAESAGVAALSCSLAVAALVPFFLEAGSAAGAAEWPSSCWEEASSAGRQGRKRVQQQQRPACRLLHAASRLVAWGVRQPKPSWGHGRSGRPFRRWGATPQGGPPQNCPEKMTPFPLC